MKTKWLLTILLISTSLGMAKEKSAVTELEIKNGWTFRQADKEKWYPASVPGCVHTDLMASNLIPDPYFGTNEKDLQWIGEKNWEYQTDFIADNNIIDKRNIRLEFKGLDTYADVLLNGTKILSADNMFREWSVDCKNILKAGTNHIKIIFRNVFDENLPKYKSAPYRLQSFDNNDQAEIKINMYSRKAGFHYGWDWGPRLITCGIYRPIKLVAWNEIKIESVQIVQKNVSEKSATIFSNLEIISDGDVNSSVNILINNQSFMSKNISLKRGMNIIPVQFEMEKPKLWWTNGLGEPYLYNFEYELITHNNLRDSKTYRVGIRSFEVVREKDSIGTSFYFKLNGKPLFAKGANYIPQDNFQNRVTLERYRHMIRSAADANMNTLRVWGGGIYEEDIFYDLCDEYGILVWQEFAFACGMFPSDDAYLNNVHNEVIDNVKRIRNHPSLAMYCGNNENEISWYQWGWKQKYFDEIQKQYEAGYHKLFYETIPNALKFVDDTRYYHPSSPSTGFNNISYNEGDAHYWSVWHGKEPFETYNSNIARFMSEYGFQSYPEMKTIKKFSNMEDQQLHSDVMLSHQRCMADERRDKEYGNRLIQWYMERQFKQPKDFESYVYVSQVLQAEGVKTAIEAHRRNMPKCMGTLYWQIDDCWPVASWSSMDYFGNWKALHYYVKQLYAPVLISPQLENDMLHIYIVSDLLAVREATLTINGFDFSGNKIFTKAIVLSISENTSKNYLSILKKDILGNRKENEIVLELELRSNNQQIAETKFYFANPKDLTLEKATINSKMTKTNNGYEIELTTNKLAKYVYLSCDENVFFTDNYFDLIPGIAKRISVNTNKNLEGKIKIISLVDSY